MPDHDGSDRKVVPNSQTELARPIFNAERAAFDACGYSAPRPLANPDLVDSFDSSAKPGKDTQNNPHMTSKAVRKLITDSNISKALAELCGPNLKLWRSRFFWKGEGSPEIAWHHDKHFFSREADTVRFDEIDTHYSVLIGLTEIGVSSGMLEVIPGSHRELPGLKRDPRPVYNRPKADHFLTGLSQDLLDARRAVPMPAGTFLVFHSALLHRSLPHLSGSPRLGIALRFHRDTVTVPEQVGAAERVLSYPDLT